MTTCKHTPDNDGHCHNCGIIINFDYHEVSGCPCQTDAFKKRTRKKVLALAGRSVAALKRQGKRIPDHTVAIIADLRAVIDPHGTEPKEDK